MSARYGWSREALNKVHIVDRIGSCGWVCEAADGDQRNQELSEHGRRAENLYFTGHRPNYFLKLQMERKDARSAKCR